MKIIHCCLAAFYIDNFSYQENILPKIHKLQGNDVFIIKNLGKTWKDSRGNENEIFKVQSFISNSFLIKQRF